MPVTQKLISLIQRHYDAAEICNLAELKETVGQNWWGSLERFCTNYGVEVQEVKQVSFVKGTTTYAVSLWVIRIDGEPVDEWLERHIEIRRDYGEPRIAQIWPGYAVVNKGVQMNQLYCLFGYERDGGKDSPLWIDPTLFPQEMQSRGAEFQERYKAWLSEKRKFSFDEIVSGVWIKLSDLGSSRQVQCHRDGTLTERELFTSDDDSWDGTWELLSGILKMTIHGYELDVVASRDGLHSGVEDYQGQKYAFFKVLHAAPEPYTDVAFQPLEPVAELQEFLMTVDEEE